MTESTSTPGRRAARSGSPIVTGAARGIGAAVATRLAADGFAVAVLDLDEAACAGTVARDHARPAAARSPSAPTFGATPSRAAAVERVAASSGRPACWSTTPASSATTCCSR